MREGVQDRLLRISTPFDLELFGLLGIKQDHQSQYNFRSQFLQRRPGHEIDLPEVARKGHAGSSGKEGSIARTTWIRLVGELGACSLHARSDF